MKDFYDLELAWEALNKYLRSLDDIKNRDTIINSEEHTQTLTKLLTSIIYIAQVLKHQIQTNLTTF